MLNRYTTGSWTFFFFLLLLILIRCVSWTQFNHCSRYCQRCPSRGHGFQARHAEHSSSLTPIFSCSIIRAFRFIWCHGNGNKRFWLFFFFFLYFFYCISFRHTVYCIDIPFWHAYLFIFFKFFFGFFFVGFFFVGFFIFFFNRLEC